MKEDKDAIIGLGFDKAYETAKEFAKDLLSRCPNAAIVNPNLCNITSNQEDKSED